MIPKVAEATVWLVEHDAAAAGSVVGSAESVALDEMDGLAAILRFVWELLPLVVDGAVAGARFELTVVFDPRCLLFGADLWWTSALAWLCSVSSDGCSADFFDPRGVFFGAAL